MRYALRLAGENALPTTDATIRYSAMNSVLQPELVRKPRGGWASAGRCAFMDRAQKWSRRACSILEHRQRMSGAEKD